MQAEERFLKALAKGIIFAGGTVKFHEENAIDLARKVWRELKEIGTDSFPCMVEQEEIRFIYQWDEYPRVLTVMVWDDTMWRDMERIEVPAGVAE